MVRLLLASLIACCLGLSARAEVPRQVRVGLFQLRPLTAVTLHGRRGPLRLAADGQRVAARRVRLTFRGGRPVLEADGQLAPARRVVLEPGPEGRIVADPGVFPPRSYRGRLVAEARGGRWVLINELDVESYLRGVLPAEMPPGWPAEALKAQAVAARTYVYANAGKRRAAGFDFSDLTEDQLYRGAEAEDPRTDRALRQTRGQVLHWRGRPIQALYASTCGGVRPANQLIFGGEPRPYLQAQADRDSRGRAYCADSPHYLVWSVGYALADLQRVLARQPATDPGRTLTGLTASRDVASGYALAVDIRGEQARRVPAYTFWTTVGPAFGWGEIKGLAFRIQPEGQRVTFIGRGCGHGVGMCQWGARGMALQGAGYRKILAHYYPGTALSARPGTAAPGG